MVCKFQTMATRQNKCTIQFQKDERYKYRWKVHLPFTRPTISFRWTRPCSQKQKPHETGLLGLQPEQISTTNPVLILISSLVRDPVDMELSQETVHEFWTQAVSHDFVWTSSAPMYTHSISHLDPFGAIFHHLKSGYTGVSWNGGTPIMDDL